MEACGAWAQDYVGFGADGTGLLVDLPLYGSLRTQWGANMDPRSTVVLTMGTPKKVLLILGNPPYVLEDWPCKGLNLNKV